MSLEADMAECEKGSDYAGGATEEPIGYKYRNGVAKEHYSQLYRVTIVVASPEFSCTVNGRSRQSIAAAHENAWFKIQAPMAERLNRP